MAKNNCLQADKLKKPAVFKLPWLDLYIIRGDEKRRIEAEIAAPEKSRMPRNKVTARLLHENLVLRNRLARWEPWDTGEER